MARSGAETRDLVAQTALRLFREHGYEATTMRRIATEAGVSLGSAYHYFDGKEELVHELYRQIQRDHRDLASPRLVDGAPLAANLRVVLHSGLDVMKPYHGFGRAFIQHALPAGSAASPFSTESQAARTMAIDLMDRVVDLSRPRPPARLRERLPTLLWLAYLGVTVHWVSDGSADQARSRALIDGLAPIVEKTVSLARLPVARGLLDDVLSLVGQVAPPATKEKP